MIPKILHYCWFGKGEIPKVAKKCFKSWEKYFSEYEIKRWDESNFDVNCNQYVAEAYKARKFMYVADVARLKALYDYGGIYLDVDCKVLKSFDGLLSAHAFTGFGGDNKELSACTMAFEKGDPFVKQCMDSYSDCRFIKSDGSLDTQSINIRMTELLRVRGFVPDGTRQTVDNIEIYPMTYFCPLSMLPDSVPDCKSADTYSMTIWTNKELLRERSFPVRLAHKLGLNKLKRKIFKGK